MTDWVYVQYGGPGGRIKRMTKRSWEAQQEAWDRYIHPRCFICDEPAGYKCGWVVARYFDGQLNTCDRHACYRHVREVDEKRAYCVNHWDSWADPKEAIQ